MKKIVMSLGLALALLVGAVSLVAAGNGCCDPTPCCTGDCNCPCCK